MSNRSLEMENKERIIRTEDISKHFGEIKAVDEVDFEVEEGEIMALIGDNGAGKTTLIKMLCGVLEPTTGKILVRDQEVEFDNFNDAREAGIEVVYQDLALAKKQTVASNVFLGHEPVRKDLLGRILRFVDEDRMVKASSQALERVEIPVDPQAKVRNLSGGQQQAVAIARALQFDPEILIMDEPTSALSVEGVRNVHGIIKSLKEEGITIILISHNIREVLTIADRVTVLAQGQLMGVRRAANTDREKLVEMMMGIETEEQVPGDSVDREGSPA